MTNKLTNRKALAFVLENVPNLPTDVREKLEGMVAALDNKAASTTRKPTTKQTENIGFRENIMNFLRTCPNRVLTCTEIGKAIPELDGMNNQRIAALMNSLEKSGQVVKMKEKGKSFFQLAKEEEEGE